MAGERILIVDDNPLNLRLTQVVLEKQRFVVELAGDGRQALKCVATFRPHLVLMDIQLPEMDGFDLAQRLKADPSNHNLLIIALTAYSMKGDEEKALRAGCDGFLTKPIESRSLPGLIRRYLDRGPTPATHSPQSVTNRGLKEVVDFDQFKDRTGGDLELMTELINLFLQEAGPLVDAARRAVSYNDSQALRNAAHALKGSVANFSAPRAYQAASNLEYMGETRDLSEAGKAWSILNNDVATLCAALAEFSMVAVHA